EDEVDDAELAAERCRRLAAVLGERLQPLAASACHDDRQRAARESAHVASGRGTRGLSGHENGRAFYSAGTRRVYRFSPRPVDAARGLACAGSAAAAPPRPRPLLRAASSGPSRTDAPAGNSTDRRGLPKRTGHTHVDAHRGRTPRSRPPRIHLWG